MRGHDLIFTKAKLEKMLLTFSDKTVELSKIMNFIPQNENVWHCQLMV